MNTHEDLAERGVVVLVFIILGIGLVSSVDAGPSPEQQCNKARYLERTKYVACVDKVFAKRHGGKPFYNPSLDLPKCHVKYTLRWENIQAKASGTGSTCDNSRLHVQGDGTTLDLLTGLQWEQKTDDGTIHDKDNIYSWSTGSPGSAAGDGTVFTVFLATLNTGSCFAGHCDWRLPTVHEQETILLPQLYPECVEPCIDQAIFGPVALMDPDLSSFWTVTPVIDLPTWAWRTTLALGYTSPAPQNLSLMARAVRGGL